MFSENRYEIITFMHKKEIKNNLLTIQNRIILEYNNLKNYLFIFL
jgi:hypothetical protein